MQTYNEFVDLVETWCKENGFPYMKLTDDWEPSTLTIQQKNGLLISIQGNTIAINDHLGYACNQKMIARTEPMRGIKYLDLHDPSLFDTLSRLIVGEEK